MQTCPGSARRNLAEDFCEPAPSSQNLQEQPNTAKGAVNRILVEAEKYKAALVAPQGTVPIDKNVRLYRQFDQDDDFFHVSCHIDDSLKLKIQNGDFVELDRLLPHERSFGNPDSLGGDEVMELISRGGHTYFDPALNKAKITSVRKWD